jgi:hypothetical protein
MTHPAAPIKKTQVFDWETEPSDERPSEFVQSTGYSVLSGFHAAPPSEASARRVHRARKGGINLLVIVGGVIVGMGALALIGFIHLMRG